MSYAQLRDGKYKKFKGSHFNSNHRFESSDDIGKYRKPDQSERYGRQQDHCDKCGSHSEHCCHSGHLGHFSKQHCNRFLIDDRCLCGLCFQLRLGGLEHGMAFRLRQLIGCPVKLDVECGDGKEQVLANICFVGSDFIEAEILEAKGRRSHKRHNKFRKQMKERIRILPFESIKCIAMND